MHEAIVYVRGGIAEVFHEPQEGMVRIIDWDGEHDAHSDPNDVDYTRESVAEAVTVLRQEGQNQTAMQLENDYAAWRRLERDSALEELFPE